MVQDDELNEIISTGNDEQLASLYSHYDKELTKLLNSADSTEDEINLIADRVLVLSTLIDTTAYQPMELNPEFISKLH